MMMEIHNIMAKQLHDGLPPMKDDVIKKEPQ